MMAITTIGFKWQVLAIALILFQAFSAKKAKDCNDDSALGEIKDDGQSEDPGLFFYKKIHTTKSPDSVLGKLKDCGGGKAKLKNKKKMKKNQKRNKPDEMSTNITQTDQS